MLFRSLKERRRVRDGERVFWERKEFVIKVQKDSSLNTQVINVDTKEGDGPTIKIGMKLMRQQICFRITAKLGNSKRQHCSRQEKKKIYMKRGPLFKKVIEGKERKEVGKTGRFFIHI